MTQCCKRIKTGLISLYCVQDADHKGNHVFWASNEDIKEINRATEHAPLEYIVDDGCPEILRRVRAAAGLKQGDGVSLVERVGELRSGLVEMKACLQREGWCPICNARLDRCEDHGEREDCIFTKIGGENG